MDGSETRNPYLSGNFAPVADESEFELKVQGEIPAGLAGALAQQPCAPGRGLIH